jgi:hypothetical protein
VHRRAVDELGAEDPAVPPGPLHRPGQPCGVCHGGAGPAEDAFVLSGTVFATPDGGEVLPGATVRYIDWVGRQQSVVTNCAGNFFVRGPAPTWPVWVRVEYGGTVAEMQSAIFRDGSCNTCHRLTPTPRHAPRVFLSEQPFPIADAGCP